MWHDYSFQIGWPLRLFAVPAASFQCEEAGVVASASRTKESCQGRDLKLIQCPFFRLSITDNLSLYFVFSTHIQSFLFWYLKIIYCAYIYKGCSLQNINCPPLNCAMSDKSADYSWSRNLVIGWALRCGFIGQVKKTEICITVIYLAGSAIAENWPLKAGLQLKNQMFRLELGKLQYLVGHRQRIPPLRLFRSAEGAGSEDTVWDTMIDSTLENLFGPENLFIFTAFHPVSILTLLNHLSRKREVCSRFVYYPPVTQKTSRCENFGLYERTCGVTLVLLFALIPVWPLDW
jgi:hypothetical protein